MRSSATPSCCNKLVVGADAGNMDLLPLLWAPDTGNVRRNVDARNPLRSSSPLGDRLTADVLAALQSFEFEGRDLRAERERLPARLAQYPAVHLSYAIRNLDRTVGGKLSGELAKRYGDAGLSPTPSSPSCAAARGRASARGCCLG